MSRVGFSIEKFLDIIVENGEYGTGVQFLFGTGAPGGDTGEQDDSPIGSIYQDKGTGHFYSKVADADSAADWKRDGFLSSGYAAAGGDPAAGDQLEDAIAKLDDNLDDLTASVGISQGDQNMGPYTGSILTDNETAKENIQELSDYIETNIAEDDSADGVTTETVIDDEIVDNVLAVEYDVVISMVDDQSRRVALKLYMTHDGTPLADAASIDDVVFAKLKHGAAFNYTLSAGLSGVTTSQVMQVKLASTETNGVNIRMRKVAQVNE